MTTFAEPPVVEFATGFQTTAVYRTDLGYTHVRGPGEDRPTPLSVPDAPVRSALAALAGDGLRLALPEARDGVLHYRATGRYNAARLSVEVDSGLDPAHGVGAVRGLGRTLRRLHTHVPVSLVASGPPGPARLAAWMRSGTGPRGAARLHTIASRYLGSDRWDRVLHWCARLESGAQRPDGDVFLHGGPGLGAVVVGTGPEDGTLFVGEEVSRGPAGFDLGWTLGEFVEWRATIDRPGGPGLDPEIHASALTALLDGYTAHPDGERSSQPTVAGGQFANSATQQGALTDSPSAPGEFEAGAVGAAAFGRAGLPEQTEVTRGAALRIFTHAHDFAAYMGWHTELLDFVAQVIELVDAEAAGAPPLTPPR
ncbi:hypothetical protein E0L36_22635 [Streptomyces sp. AJS327]|uniref:hypothetical protein n=1 Tax=Streptomyces sp. AJS327 TaxID=2545265 RepID=UPI0015DF7438|nr:hypothetical protein [Streptomyces sp. AJS327]MBA0053571.1 hypothetical protein [Streptomyces sp. AJS327]